MVDVQVEFEYSSHEDDELSIKPGDTIKDVNKMDGGWWEGVLNGKRGMFPDNFVKEITKKEKVREAAPLPANKKPGGGHVANLAKNLGNSGIKLTAPVSQGKAENKDGKKKILAKATFAYSPQHDDELGLEVGEIVEVTKQEEAGWWEGTKNGKSGVFPSNFVDLVTEDSSSADEAEKVDKEKNIPEGEVQEIKGKKVKGVGLGDIFGGMPIKLRSASRDEEPKPEPKTEPRSEPRNESKTKKGTPTTIKEAPILPPKEVKEPKSPFSPDYKEGSTPCKKEGRLSEVGFDRNKDIVFFNMTGDSMMVYDVQSFTSPESSELYVTVESGGDFATPDINVSPNVAACVSSEDSDNDATDENNDYSRTSSDHATLEDINDGQGDVSYQSDESTEFISMSNFSKVWNDAEGDDIPLELSTLSQARQTPPPKHSFLRKRKSRGSKDSPAMPLYQSTPSHDDDVSDAENVVASDTEDVSTVENTTPESSTVEETTSNPQTTEKTSVSTCIIDDVPENKDHLENNETEVRQLPKKDHVQSTLTNTSDDLLGFDYTNHYVRYKDRWPPCILADKIIGQRVLDPKMFEKSCGDSILLHSNNLVSEDEPFDAGKITDSVKLTKHRLSMPEYCIMPMYETSQVNMVLEDSSTKPPLYALTEVHRTRPSASSPEISIAKKTASLPRKLNFGKEKLEAANEKSSTLPPSSSLKGTASMKQLGRRFSMLNPRMFFKKVSNRNRKISESKEIVENIQVIEPENYIQYLHRHEKLSPVVFRLMERYQIFPDGKLEGSYSWYYKLHVDPLVMSQDRLSSITGNDAEKSITKLAVDTPSKATLDDKSMNSTAEQKLKKTPSTPKLKRKAFLKRTQSEGKQKSKSKYSFKIKKTPTPHEVSDTTTRKQDISLHSVPLAPPDQAAGSNQKAKRRSSIFRIFSAKGKSKTKHNTSEVSSVGSSVMQPDLTPDSAGLSDLLAAEDMSTRTLRGDSDINSNLVLSDQDHDVATKSDKGMTKPEVRPSDVSLDSLPISSNIPVRLHDDILPNINEQMGVNDLSYVGVEMPSYSAESSKRCSIVATEGNGVMPSVDNSVGNNSTLPGVLENLKESTILTDDLPNLTSLLPDGNTPNTMEHQRFSVSVIKDDDVHHNNKEIVYVHQQYNTEVISEIDHSNIDDHNTNQSANPYDGYRPGDTFSINHAPVSDQGLLSPVYLKASPQKYDDNNDAALVSTTGGLAFSTNTSEGQIDSYVGYHSDSIADSQMTTLPSDSSYTLYGSHSLPYQYMSDASVSSREASCCLADKPVGFHRIYKCHSHHSSPHNKSCIHEQDCSKSSSMEVFYDKIYDDEDMPLLYSQSLPLTASGERRATGQHPEMLAATGLNESDLKLQDVSNTSGNLPANNDSEQKPLAFHSGQTYENNVPSQMNKRYTYSNAETYKPNESMEFNLLDDMSHLIPGLSKYSKPPKFYEDNSGAGEGYDEVSGNTQGYDEVSGLAQGYDEVSGLAQGYDEVHAVAQDYDDVSGVAHGREAVANNMKYQDPQFDDGEMPCYVPQPDVEEMLENLVYDSSNPNVIHQLLSNTTQNAQDYYYTLGGLSPRTTSVHSSTSDTTVEDKRYQGTKV